jgi:polar amino acid transport system substrate-binding protein
MAGQVGGEPFFAKDIVTGEWRGFAIDFGKDLAKELGVKLEVVESGWGQSVLDLQTNKIELSMALTPMPKRALSVDFSTPVYYTPYGVIVRPGFKQVKTWEDLNDPKITIAADIGTTHETFARRYAPKANIIVFKTWDEVIMAMTGKRADAISTGALGGLTTVSKNRQIGKFVILEEPLISGPVSAAVPRENDKTFRDFVSIWADYNRLVGNTREWILRALYATGVNPSDIPRGLSF